MICHPRETTGVRGVRQGWEALGEHSLPRPCTAPAGHPVPPGVSYDVGMTERETRIRDLRWRLFNARSFLEGDLELYKQVHAAGLESKALSVHERICSARRRIPELEAELAALEGEAPTAGRPGDPGPTSRG